MTASIDDAVDGLCACGCGKPVPPDGPSGWFATEPCQEAWQHRRVGAAADHSDWDDLIQAVNAFAETWRTAAAQMTEVMVRFAADISAFAKVVEPLRAPTPPSDLMERALWLMRNRNTGPAGQQRTPRRIDPRRSR